MKKRTETVIAVSVALLVLIMVLLFAFHPYFKKPQIGGSTGADLVQELTSIYGEEYEGKVLAESTTDAGTIRLQEDMHFSIEPDKYRHWNDTMLAADRFGTPLSKEGWISIYTVKVEFTRYTTLNDEVRSELTEQKVISYIAYEDNAVHSSARASLDLSSAKTQYGTTADNFENMAVSE